MMAGMKGWGLAGLAALAACRGTAPRPEHTPEHRFAAVVMGGRIILQTGEAQRGEVAINLEGEGGRQAMNYRLAVPAGRAALYPVEPGIYRLTPTRSLLGGHQDHMPLWVESDSYRAPFPRDILRKRPFEIRPKRITALGILEARLTLDPRTRQPRATVRLDESVEARRRVVQELIQSMMSPATPAEERKLTIGWSQALDTALSEIIAETQRAPLFKPAP